MNQAERFNQIAAKLGLPARALPMTEAVPDILMLLDVIVERILQLEDDLMK